MNSQTIYCFPAIASEDATQLILGSIPGKESLRTNEYYAHHRNSFWKIMGRLFQFDHTSSYDARCRQLIQAKLALWDVLSECVRSTSLDSDIIDSSINVNNFSQFYAEHPQIRRLLFNGTTAERTYMKYVYPQLNTKHQSIDCVRLPSTSPAHAKLTFEDKLKVWRRSLTE